MKESDRLAAMGETLAAAGARIELFEDGCAIEGPTPLRGVPVAHPARPPDRDVDGDRAALRGRRRGRASTTSPASRRASRPSSRCSTGCAGGASRDHRPHRTSTAWSATPSRTAARPRCRTPPSPHAGLDAVYVALPVAPDRLDEALAGRARARVPGAQRDRPAQAGAASRSASTLDPVAAAGRRREHPPARAANGWEGFNTDAPACLALARGGRGAAAARARSSSARAARRGPAAWALLALGAELRVAARRRATPRRARASSSRRAGRGAARPARARRLGGPRRPSSRGADAIVNATSRRPRRARRRSPAGVRLRRRPGGGRLRLRRHRRSRAPRARRRRDGSSPASSSSSARARSPSPSGPGRPAPGGGDGRRDGARPGSERHDPPLPHRRRVARPRRSSPSPRASRPASRSTSRR